METYGNGYAGMMYSQASAEPTKSEKLYTYLLLLFESQKSGHDVHSEIDEALKAYRTEVGI